jgi:hypothetical protein
MAISYQLFLSRFQQCVTRILKGTAHEDVLPNLNTDQYFVRY